MEWVCVALIIGSMVYSGVIVVEYTNFTLELRPQISQLERKATEWANSAQIEVQEKDRIKEDIRSIKDQVSDLQLAVDEAKLRRQASQLRKKRLEMVLLKSSIRARRPNRISIS